MMDALPRVGDQATRVSFASQRYYAQVKGGLGYLRVVPAAGEPTLLTLARLSLRPSRHGRRPQAT